MKKENFNSHEILMHYAIKKKLKKDKIKKRKKNRNRDSEHDNYFRIPKIFKIYAQHDAKNRNLASKFLIKLEKKIQNTKKSVSLNFVETQHLSPCAMIILLSLMQKGSSKGVKFRLYSYTRNNKIHQVLQQLGILELVSPDLPKTKITRDDVECWHKQEILHDETNRGAIIKTFLQAIESIQNNKEIPKILIKALYGAIDEAVLNMRQHAYPDSPQKNQLTGWILWSFSKNDNQFSIWAYDSGLGIPETIKKHSSLTKHLRKLIIKNTDSEWIKVATKISKTSTKKPFRGKGLPQIIDCALKNNGSVLIISNGGQFHESKENDKYNLKKPKKIKSKINGTIIAWEFKLNENN